MGVSIALECDGRLLCGSRRWRPRLPPGLNASAKAVLQLVEKQHRVQPWWRTGANGSVVLFVRLGGKPIEFDKGKSGIAVATVEKLPGVIDTLVAAVRNGELDTVLAQSAKRPPMQKKKAA